MAERLQLPSAPAEALKAFDTMHEKAVFDGFTRNLGIGSVALKLCLEGDPQLAALQPFSKNQLKQNDTSYFFRATRRPFWYEELASVPETRVLYSWGALYFSTESTDDQGALLRLFLDREEGRYRRLDVQADGLYIARYSTGGEAELDPFWVERRTHANQPDTYTVNRLDPLEAKRAYIDFLQPAAEYSFVPPALQHPERGASRWMV